MYFRNFDDLRVAWQQWSQLPCESNGIRVGFDFFVLSPQVLTKFSIEHWNSPIFFKVSLSLFTSLMYMARSCKGTQSTEKHSDITSVSHFPLQRLRFLIHRAIFQAVSGPLSITARGQCRTKRPRGLGGEWQSAWTAVKDDACRCRCQFSFYLHGFQGLLQLLSLWTIHRVTHKLL